MSKKINFYMNTVVPSPIHETTIVRRDDLDLVLQCIFSYILNYGLNDDGLEFKDTLERLSIAANSSLASA